MDLTGTRASIQARRDDLDNQIKVVEAQADPLKAERGNRDVELALLDQLIAAEVQQYQPAVDATQAGQA